MAGILKPLAVFCSQSQSQRYIKTVRNLGDSWRTLADDTHSRPAADEDDTIIEATFDLITKIKSGANKQSFFVAIDVPSTTEKPHEAPATTEGHSSGESPDDAQTLRHYRIFADYGTDFIWLNTNDPEYAPENTYVEAQDVLASSPQEVFQNYDAWVETYSQNFKTRCEETQNYSANVFVTATEQVAWQVAGYLLAWRIAKSSKVGSVEYSPAKEKYLLELGKESEITKQFLEDQAALLLKGEPS